MAVTPSMTFSRTALDVFGRNTDPIMAGNELTTLPTVFRKMAGVKVRFALAGFCGGALAQASEGRGVVVMGVASGRGIAAPRGLIYGT
jgi:hypothetical protein